jgi:TPR repeat protein
MTSHLKQFNLIAAAIVVTAVTSLGACTEKKEGSNRTETVLPAVTEDKIARLQREAEEGDPDAQYSLAYMYENGLGVPKNETKALELYQQAADQGHPAAQDNLDAMKSTSK